ncbi:MAG: hypothetical protein MJ091_03360 [Clostridia bacterium]|nr:hypothetical protein [Clostridia bacterium]
MKKVKIGLLPLYVKLYDDDSPNMRPRIEAFATEIQGIFESRDDVELVKFNICRIEDEFKAAVELFEKENVDSIVTLHMAYSPSLESEKVLKNTKLPIVILDTTPTYDFTYNDDTSVISYNHGIHGVQDMCNLLVRNNKQFFIETGHYKNSDVIERVISRVKGIKVASELKKAKAGTIGGAFAGMGDFVVTDSQYDLLGIKRIKFAPEDAEKFSSLVTEEEINALIESDKEKYIVSDNIPEEKLLSSAKGSLTVRKWIEANGLTAFTANFLTVKKDFGIDGMPFAEANREMERGIGYAGEGDMLTASFLGALMSVSNQATFIEMFCPDWKENLIYISHMGEMNTALTASKPKLEYKTMKYSDIDTTYTYGTYKPGAATLICLVPTADSFRIVTSKVNMKTALCEKVQKKNVSGWFEPNMPVADFLTEYSKLGGTHHLTLMYGDARKLAETFAEVKGFEYFEI